MAADAAGNDLDAIGIPVGGLWAFAEYKEENVIPDEDMGKTPLVLTNYHKLGLQKVDGGAQDGREGGEAIELFNEGYKLNSPSQLRITIGLAEANANVQRLIDGKEPNEEGVVYVDDSLPDAKLILFGATKYKNGFELRRNGVAQIVSVEVDQETRGEINGKAVTFEWSPDDFFADPEKGKAMPYKKWYGRPGAAPAPDEEDPETP